MRVEHATSETPSAPWRSSDPHLHPVRATFWGGLTRSVIEDLESGAGLDQLQRALKSEDPTWIEASFEGLDDEMLKWFGGSFDVWQWIDIPHVDWSQMEPILASVGLKPPDPDSTERDTSKQRLLREIPYVFSRGVFGTARDAISRRQGATVRNALADEKLTLFPVVGFRDAKGLREARRDGDPDVTEHDEDSTDAECEGPSYTVLRTAVGVVRQVVLTVRLPDARCAKGVGPDTRIDGPPARLQLPSRYLPLWRRPDAHEVAEAIGIHQAATVRAVANRVNESLETSETLVRELRSIDEKEAARRHDLRNRLVEAAKETDQEAEIVRQLDRRISRLLRRFGGKGVDGSPQSGELVPPEVRTGYRNALEEVKSLHEDYRLASQVVAEALSVYYQDRRDQFQLTAAMLASIVLVPTLIASIFGVNFATPAKENVRAFALFVIVIVALGVAGSLALKSVRETDWSKPPIREVRAPVAIALAALAGLAAGLIWWAH